MIIFAKKKDPMYTPFSYTERYGIRLQRLAVDGGFTCPNRDGRAGTGGCTFCNNEAFHPAYTKGKSITQQIDAGTAFHARKKADGYLAYFQAFSNTYAPLEELKLRYSEALKHPAVRGLVIGTRPDCIDPEKLDYLEGLKRQGHVVELEFGIESVYDATLRRVNRGHNFACTREAFREAAKRGIPTGGHIILGLPGETQEMILQEADVLNALPLESLKIHQLQILKGTPMAAEFQEKPEDFLRLGPEGYIRLLSAFLERLRPDIAIGRIVSTVPASYSDAPWGLLRHDRLQKMLLSYMKETNTWQGKLWEEKI